MRWQRIKILFIETGMICLFHGKRLGWWLVAQSWENGKKNTTYDPTWQLKLGTTIYTPPRRMVLSENGVLHSIHGFRTMVHSPLFRQSLDSRLSAWNAVVFLQKRHKIAGPSTASGTSVAPPPSLLLSCCLYLVHLLAYVTLNQTWLAAGGNSLN